MITTPVWRMSADSMDARWSLVELMRTVRTGSGVKLTLIPRLDTVGPTDAPRITNVPLESVPRTQLSTQKSGEFVPNEGPTWLQLQRK